MESIEMGEGGSSATPTREEESRRTRVLLADDDPVNAVVAKAMLEKLECEVTVVEDGRRAVVAAESRPFDLVILDRRMPGLDGFEAARALRARPATAEVPILALSADDGDAGRERAREVGMDDYLTKPLTLAALRRALDRWLAPPTADAPPPSLPGRRSRR